MLTYEIQSSTVYFLLPGYAGYGYFYRDILGLKLVKRDEFDLSEWAEFGGAGFRLCLHKSGSPAFVGKIAIRWFLKSKMWPKRARIS